MNTLALDIATITGWATNHGSGTWNLKPNRGESEGMRVIRFRAKVQELIKLEDIDQAVYERAGGMHASSIATESEMIGVLKALCIDEDVNLACYSANEIKKHATGKGNSGKPAMIAAAKAKWPDTKIIDDNHADALWLLDLFLTEMGERA